MKDWIIEWLAEKTTWTGMFLVVSTFGFAATAMGVTAKTLTNFSWAAEGQVAGLFIAIGY